MIKSCQYYYFLFVFTHVFATCPVAKMNVALADLGHARLVLLLHPTSRLPGPASITLLSSRPNSHHAILLFECALFSAGKMHVFELLPTLPNFGTHLLHGFAGHALLLRDLRALSLMFFCSSLFFCFCFCFLSFFSLRALSSS